MSIDHRTQVLQATDLVELISQTVALKRRGKTFVGLCPFHQEKTPSFHVDPGRQYFHCFGCKASGTAFDFVMLRDRVDFRQSLEILARTAGIELPQFGGAGQKPGERQALLDAHSAACRFFENQFWHEQQGAAAREYLHGRGFTDESLKRFQVGLAADAWDALLRGPVGKKFAPPLLLTAGLLKARDGGDGHYDTFRNRIMFPIRSEAGQIIAFGGRIMQGADDSHTAKYLNSPETPLFNKSRSIFGLDFARQRIIETRTVAVVEGYTDVVMAHQFGASNVVSPLGTAMTEQHVTVLRRFADRIVLLFDADAAGDAAVDRVVQLFLTQPVEIAVASMPDGLDPDEYLLKFGLTAFDKLLAEATDALEYAWKQTSRRFVSEEGDLTAQQKATAKYLDLLGSAQGSGPVDALRWGAALARVGRLTGIPVEELHRRFKSTKPRPQRSGMSNAASAGPAEAANFARPEEPARPLTAQIRAERDILGVLLVEPGRWRDVQLSLGAGDFTEERLRRLAEALWNHQRDEGETVFNEFLVALGDGSLVALAIELVDAIEQLPDLNTTLQGALDYLAQVGRKREDQKTVAEARRGTALSDDAQAELLRRVQENSRRPDIRRGVL